MENITRKIFQQFKDCADILKANGFANAEGTRILFEADEKVFGTKIGADIANLKEGDIISFDARVAKYVKGYKGDWWYFFEKTGHFPTPISTDYKLERPTKMKIESN